MFKSGHNTNTHFKNTSTTRTSQQYKHTMFLTKQAQYKTHNIKHALQKTQCKQQQHQQQQH